VNAIDDVDVDEQRKVGLMSRLSPTDAALREWIAGEALPFSLDDPEGFNAAVAALIATLGDQVELLGFGEALHGGEELLTLRNRLFQRLVEAHGYTAIAIESSFPRGELVNDFVLGLGAKSYAAVEEAGFSNAFGQLAANRELIEWMRRYNADPAHRVKVHFYGFDLPLVAAGPASPRELLHDVLSYLATSDVARAQQYRQRIAPHLGQDAEWEDPMAWRNPAKSLGLLARATALRLVTEDLIVALRTRRPDLVAKSDGERYVAAQHRASMVRELLNFFVALAEDAGFAEGLAVRDAQMADNLIQIVSTERVRGKVLVFAHNSHLLRGRAEVPMGLTEVATWWPAGAQVATTLGPRYAAIGAAVGVSEENGIGQPEDGTLEARLLAAFESPLFIATKQGDGLSAAEVTALPTRSGSVRNRSYIPLSSQSFTDFDWLAFLPAVTFWRGGRPLPD
jgi:erythromycin esterase-like protein